MRCYPVTLEVLHDGIVLGEVLACDYRPDLRKAGMGRGYSAFHFNSPIRITPAMHAGLSVRRKHDGANLGVNPEILRATPTIATAQTSAVPQLRIVGGAP